MGGPELGNFMTNAVIESFDSKILKVVASGTPFQITVPPDTEVLRPLPATFADAAVGRRCLAVGPTGPDGVMVATSLNLVGEPPVLLP
jgi:hypothetical protein